MDIETAPSVLNGRQFILIDFFNRAEDCKMKAAVFEKAGCLALKNISTPRYRDPSETLIKVEVASICGSDLGMLEGKVDVCKTGTVLGHEFVGFVIGADFFNKKINLRDRVAINPYVACEGCNFCRRGATNRCQKLTIIGGHVNGGFSEHCLVPSDNLYKIGDIDLDLAVFIQPLACSLAGFEKLSIGKDAKVLIFGGGPMGLLLARMCEDNGAVATISEPSLFRRRFAEEMGWGTIDPNLGGDIPSSAADVVIDAVGSLMKEALDCAINNGEVLLFGLNAKSKKQYDLTLGEAKRQIRHKKKKIYIKGSFLARDKHFKKAIELMRDKNWAGFLRSMITARIPLNKIHDGFDLVRKGEAIKILVYPN